MSLLWTAVAAGLVAIVATVAVERLGGRTGGVVATLPTTIVPASWGFVAASQLGWADAMAAVPVGMLVDAGFLWCWRVLPPRLPVVSMQRRLLMMVLASLAAWFVLAAFAMLAATWLDVAPLALGLVAFAAHVGLGLYTTWAPFPAPKGGQRVAVWVLLSRGLLAGAAIAVSVVIAQSGWELAAGVASVFPAIFVTTMVALWWSQGEAVPLGAVGPIVLGSTAVSMYALVGIVVFEPLGLWVGTAVAWGTAVLTCSVPTAWWLGGGSVGSAWKWISGALGTVAVAGGVVCFAAPQLVLEASIRVERARGGLTRHTDVIDGLRWVWLDGGRPEAPVVLAVHGFNGDKDNWTRLAPYLTDQFRVLAPDLPAHGETGYDPSLSYDVDSQVERLIRYLDHLEVDRAHVVGNSMGGAIAARLSALAPTRVDHVVLLAPGFVETAQASEMDDLLSLNGPHPLIARSPEQFEVVLDWVMEKRPYIPGPVLQFVAERSAARASIADRVWEDLFATPATLVADSDGIVAPTLVVWGREDRILHVSGAEAMCSRVIRCDWTVMEGVGHVPMLEKPAETAALILDFVSSRPAPVQGRWRSTLQTPAGPLPFVLDVSGDGTAIINGAERIDLGHSVSQTGWWSVDIDHYDARLVGRVSEEGSQVRGRWLKRVHAGKSDSLPWTAEVSASPRFSSAQTPGGAGGNLDLTGTWTVRFDSGPAIGHFKQSDDVLQGTFETPTGDVRYLEGIVGENGLVMSTFDGAHAFLFSAEMTDVGLTGTFTSGSRFREGWTAERAPDTVALPGALIQSDPKRVDWSALTLPDVNGDLVSMSSFIGGPTVIELFGSWCPNCHDAGAALRAIVAENPEITVVGVAFEVSSDAARNQAQVRRYLKRHGLDMPVLVANTSDKDEAGATLGFLDRVDAYPTLLFVGSDGVIEQMMVGFSGPATGTRHQEMMGAIRMAVGKLN